jgi:hypothetical protein
MLAGAPGEYGEGMKAGYGCSKTCWVRVLCTDEWLQCKARTRT